MFSVVVLLEGQSLRHPSLLQPLTIVVLVTPVKSKTFMEQRNGTGTLKEVSGHERLREEWVFWSQKGRLQKEPD